MPAQQLKVIPRQGIVQFESKAQLETIKAKSKSLEGTIDCKTRNLFFKIQSNSFTGFNSPLQKEHFTENYLESEIFTDATFEGKLVEQINICSPGNYQVRAKGKFQVHGVVQERIIQGFLVTKGNTATLKCDFVLELSDHNINIPRIVHKKIAEQIFIRIEAAMMIQ